MEENELNLILQKFLCRFCDQPSTSTNPFIVACLCQGPNACIHAPCLEDWLSTNKQKNCDVCMHKYETELSKRSVFEWLRSAYANEQSHKRQFHQLLIRASNILWALVFSAAIIWYTPTINPFTDGLYWYLMQKVFNVLLLLFGLLRLGWCLYAVTIFGQLTLTEFLQWRANNLKVKIKPCSGYRPMSNIPKRSATRAAGLKPKKFSKTREFMEVTQTKQAQNDFETKKDQ